MKSASPGARTPSPLACPATVPPWQVTPSTLQPGLIATTVIGRTTPCWAQRRDVLTADVRIAIGAGTDVAVEAGDVVLARSGPRDVPRIIAMSRASYRKMVQNLWWAAGYNIVAIPLAAGVLVWQGIVLAPAFAAVLMSASTVIVVINAQLLRCARL